MTGDRPDARELVEAVAAWLTEEHAPGLEGGERFQALVAAQALAIAARELELGGGHEAADAAELGDASELAAAIRAGERDEELGELAARLREHVRRKLAVARPGYDGG